ncbi:MAG: 3'-5' exonuclease, partial [Candidatus Woesearchaeota archaeon]|nr:3'-5' exonuclease [Candidatus Woesearchaeota archaeon]
MIVIDCETTGLLSEKHSIISVGAVEFEHPERQFYMECQAWAGSLFDPVALNHIGFTEAQCKDSSKPSARELLLALKKWISEAQEQTPAGHNCRFDVEFLYASGARESVAFPFPFRMIDLHSIAYAHMLSHGVIIPLKDFVSALSLNK